MRAQDYMMQYKQCQARIASLNADIRILRDRASGLTAMQYDSDRVQSSHIPDKMGEAIADMSDTIEALSEEIKRADAIMLQVESTVERVSKIQYQEVLKRRYIYDYESKDPEDKMTADERAVRLTSWEVIAEKMHFCGQSIWRFHKQALKEVDVIINSGE